MRAVLRHAATRAGAFGVVTALMVIPAASPAFAATWTVVPSANQTAFNNLFTGTDILSATSGWAVGWADTGTTPGRTPIIQRYDGTRLAAVISPTVSGGGQLSDVDASSAGNAWAVGNSNTNGGTSGLTERWNGAAWQIVPIDDPAPGFQNFLSGVKSFADGTAWAVGASSSPGSLNFVTVAQLWSGGGWKHVPTPSPVVGTNELLDVDGVTPNDVWAVGFTQIGQDGVPQPLVEHWDGGSWKVVNVPAERAASLNAVVTIAADDVWAVGTQFSLELLRFLPYTLHWDGASWKEVEVPASATTVDRLNGVAAAGPKQVYAVGGNTVLRFNGTTWSPEATGFIGGTLIDAAGAGPSSILAVGSRPRDAIGTTGTLGLRTNNG